jgi:hypothetical protein
MFGVMQNTPDSKQNKSGLISEQMSRVALLVLKASGVHKLTCSELFAI